MRDLKDALQMFIFVTAIMLTQLNTAQAKVVLLKQNQPAPYAGYLFDENSQRDARTAVMQLDEFKKLDKINSEIIKEQQSQLESSTFYKIIYFVGGAVVGGVVVKAVSK